MATLGVGPQTGFTSGGSTATLVLELTGTTTGGSLVVGVAWVSGTATITSVTCSGESNLTVQGTPTRNSTASTQFALLPALTSGGDKTVTITMSASLSAGYIAGYAVEVNDVNTASLVNVENGATGSSATPSVGLTTTEDNCAVFTIIGSGGLYTPAAGSGYTAITVGVAGMRNAGGYDLDVGTAGSISVPYTAAGTTSFSAKAIALNPPPPPPEGDVDDDLPAHTVAATGFGDAHGEAENDLPVHTLDSEPPTTGDADNTLAIHTITAQGAAPYADAAATLPVYTIVAGGTAGLIGTVALPAHLLTASGGAGQVATTTLSLPAHALTAGGNHTGAISLLAHTLTASSQTGNVGTAANTLPFYELAVVAVAEGHGTAANDLPAHQLLGAGSAVNSGTLTVTLAVHRLEAVAYSGVVGTAAITLPIHSLTTVAYAAITGSASITLPGHQLEAAGLQALVEAYRTWVLNLRNAGLTEFDNFDFNSFALFNGAYLAAGPDGIVVLGTEDTDDEDEIGWRIRTGSVDYGSTYHKRVPRLYVTGEFSGDVYFRSITSEDGERTYLLPSNGITGVQQRRVPIGKGPKSLQWQFELEDVDGSDVRLQRIMPYPEELRRRVA